MRDGHKPEIWVSDLYSAQRNHSAQQWQACLAHQLRDCEYAIEAGDKILAPEMKRLLLRSFAVHKRRSRLKENTFYPYRGDIKRRLTQCLEREPTQKDGVRLKKRFRNIKENWFLFLEVDETIVANKPFV